MAITIEPRLNPPSARIALILVAGAAALTWWFARADDPAPAPAIASTPVAFAQTAPTGEVAATPAPAALTPADVADIRVHGTFAHAAIITVKGGAQQRIAVGRQILPGIVFERSATDHIVVARGGTRAHIPLARFDGDAPTPTMEHTPAQAASPQGVKSPSNAPVLSRSAFSGENARRQTLAFQLGLEREVAADVTVGFRVRKAASMPVFARAGLRDGDIVTTINGGTLHDEEKVIELAGELAQSRQVTIGYLRDGSAQDATVQFND